MNASLLRRSIADNFPIDSTAVPTLTMSQISQRVARLRLLNSSSDRKTSWANPEASIGDFCRSMGRSQCWHAKGPARDLFIRLAAEVKTYLDRNCEPPTRELHWSLYMIGQTKSTARPVLMFICEDGNSRRSARKTIKDSGILLRYPGVDTADCSYPPDFGQLVQLALRRNMDDLEDLTHAGSFSMDTEESYYSNFTHPVFSHRRIRSGRAVMGGFGIPSDYGQLAQQPVFEDHKDGLVIKPGKSETSVFYRPTDSILGSHVFLEDSRGNTPTSRKATAGVIVKLGDKICFLTAAHAFISRRPPSDSCPPFEYDIDGESDSDDEEFLQTIRQGSRSPLSEQSNWGLGESEKSISRSSSSQESELDTEETVTGRVTTDPTATVVATSTTHNSFQQTLDDSTHHHRRHSPRGSRSPSHSRARFSTSDGLGAAAFTGAVALVRNNSQDGSRNYSRYRGRSQSRGGDTASRLESRIEYMPAVSSTGPATAGLIERARSKSRSRSKSRIKQVAHASAQERPLESGTLLASSIEGSEKGLDYALIKIEGSYISMRNQLRFNNGIFDLTLNLTRVSDARPKDAKIVAITGSSGYLSGRLLGTPSFSRASDQDAQVPSQELWTVKFDGKLKEGDCGTCVFDAQTGDFYGHVVAGNRDSGYAYIVPAYQIREDLARRLGENLQFYAPAIYLLYQKLFTLADRLPIRNNESQLQRSRRESSQTTSDNVYKPVSSETRKSHTPNFLERHSRDASHGAALVRKGSEYFTPGRIFVVRWSEPIKALRTKASSNSEDISVINGQPMISYWRRMVVIKTSQAGNSSTCVGMFTYGGQGLARPGLDLDKHALVFDERLDEPRTRPDEPSLKGPPLAVCMESPFEKLDPMYRINFGVTYTVEHNMEIRDVGHIAEGSMKNFETYVAEALKTN